MIPPVADCAPVPMAFFAATLKVYVVAFKPGITSVVAVELNVWAESATPAWYSA